jgi:hypothetical protein
MSFFQCQCLLQVIDISFKTILKYNIAVSIYCIDNREKKRVGCTLSIALGAVDKSRVFLWIACLISAISCRFCSNEKHISLLVYLLY